MAHRTPCALLLAALAAACASAPGPEHLAQLHYGMPRTEVAAAAELEIEERFWIDVESSRYVLDEVEFGGAHGRWSLVSCNDELVAVRPGGSPRPLRSEARELQRIDEWIAARPALEHAALEALAAEATGRRAWGLADTFEAVYFGAILTPFVAVGYPLHALFGSDASPWDAVRAEQRELLVRARGLTPRAPRSEVRALLGAPVHVLAPKGLQALERWYYESGAEDGPALATCFAFDDAGLRWVDTKCPPVLERGDPSGSGPRLEPLPVGLARMGLALAHFGALVGAWR